MYFFLDPSKSKSNPLFAEEIERDREVLTKLASKEVKGINKSFTNTEKKTTVKKKGALLTWFEDSEKDKAENAMRKQELMNEIYMKRQSEKMKKAQDKEQQQLVAYDDDDF